MLTDAQKKMLAQDLPREEIKILPGKKDRDGSAIGYIDGHYVIERLNQVFGHDGWSDTYGAPTIVDPAAARPVVHVVCTLAAAGATKSDVGVGLAATDSPDSLETAIKAAYTDALKRAARKFGASFGLALYDKDKNNRAIGWRFEVQELIAALDGAHTADAYKAARTLASAAWDTLSEDEKDAVKARMESAASRVKGTTQPAATPPSGEHRAASTAQTPAPASVLSVAGAELLARVRHARSEETLVASLKSSISADERPTLWGGALKTAMARGIREEVLRARLDAAQRLNISPAQWGVASDILASFDAAVSIDELDAARKAAAEKGRTLPAELLSGIKRVSAERRNALGGASAIAERLIGRAGQASEQGLADIYAELERELASGGCTKADADRVVAALNARGEVIARVAA